MKKEKLVLPLIILLAAALRLTNLLDFHSLDSDEAVYSQMVFALTKGLIPYKDIYLPHPPVYFFISYPIMLADPSLYLIRAFNVALSLGTLYMIFKICESAYSRLVAMVSSLIYAIYPFAIYTSKLVLVDNGLSFFISISIFFLTKYMSKNDIKYITFAGFFAGVSCMTKYTGIFVSIAIVIFILIRVRRIKPLLFFIAGFLIIPVGILIWLLSSNMWQIFYTQTVYWQVIRTAQPLSEKILSLTASFGVISLLMLFATPMIIAGVGNANDELMMLLFFIPLISILTSKLIFIQYFIVLLIPLCILVARTIDHYQLYIHGRTYLKHSWKRIVTVLIIAIIIENILYIYTSPIYAYNYQIITSSFVNDQEKALLEKQIAAGNYIKEQTDPKDKIWTSDAALAFFSQRVMVTTDSKYWKYQGFFADIWGYG